MSKNRDDWHSRLGESGAPDSGESAILCGALERRLRDRETPAMPARLRERIERRIRRRRAVRIWRRVAAALAAAAIFGFWNSRPHGGFEEGNRVREFSEAVSDSPEWSPQDFYGLSAPLRETWREGWKEIEGWARRKENALARPEWGISDLWPIPSASLESREVWKEYVYEAFAQVHDFVERCAAADPRGFDGRG